MSSSSSFIHCYVIWLLFLTVIQEQFIRTNAISDSLALYPWPTETRQTLSLDGVWTFRITDYSLNNELFGFQHANYFHVRLMNIMNVCQYRQVLMI
ncbi:hypothetical protein BLA29_011610 [Euroglyphus maynei]|uniref:Beta-glucuronidase n=1 Tax=Euroglyphus maynei TaxID=6958 RepID=A0A1Y3B2J5_EURMA|nr:hypothetical protein BLA29_011610 [Euroglyphus maynei]